MEQTRQLQCYELVDNNNLLISEMPEKIRNKFKSLDDILENYENATSEKEEKDIMAQIEAYDTGLSSDIRSYLEQKGNSDDDDESASKSQEQMKQGGQTEDQPNLDKPSWRFWM